MSDNSNYSEEELEELEEKLLKEAEEEREDEMHVSGRSVFEIERLKRKRESDKEERD